LRNQQNLSNVAPTVPCLLLLGGKRSKELELFLVGLESSVSQLGGSIDELDVDGLEVLPGGMVHQRLTKDQSTLLNSNSGTLEHDPVLVDLSIVGESSHRSDALLSKISSGTARAGISLLSNAVDLLVHLGTVEVSILTGTGHSSGHTCRMP